MEFLLEVAERMREAKMAPILAQMNFDKASAITADAPPGGDCRR